MGEVALACVIGEGSECGSVFVGGGPLEGADADVAGGDAGEDGAGEVFRACYGFSGGGDGEAAGGGDVEGVHGFADEIFAKHGAEGCATIAAAGEWGAAGAFELDVEALAEGCDVFA